LLIFSFLRRSPRSSKGEAAPENGFGGGAQGVDMGRGARQIGLVKVVDNPLGLRMLPKLMDGSDLFAFFGSLIAMAGTFVGQVSFIYRYILRDSCSQFDSLPLTSLTFVGQLEQRKRRTKAAKMLAAGALFGLARERKVRRTASKAAGAGLFAALVRQRQQRRRAALVLCAGLVPSLLADKIVRARATNVAGAAIFASLLRERDESVAKAKLFATGWLTSLLPKRGKKKKAKVNRVVLRFDDVDDIDDTVFADMGGDDPVRSSFLFLFFSLLLLFAHLFFSCSSLSIYCRDPGRAG